MTTEDAPPRPLTPECSVMSYEVATTSIIYGLPPDERSQILQRYRSEYREQAARSPDHGSQTFHGLNVMYDLACQYLKNMHGVHAVEVQDTQADSDSEEDSIFSNDDLPDLLPLPPSSGASPVASSSAELGTDSPTTPLGAASARGEVHGLRIMGAHTTRDVQCDCTDRLHSVYARRDVFAFCDHEGNLVIKKSKIVLVPLD